MKDEIDDPKWTAYTLGDTTGEERARLEEELRISPEARRFVEQTRETAALIREALALNTAGKLAEAQRSKVLNRTQAVGFQGSKYSNGRLTLLAVAAAALIGLLVPFWKHRSADPPPTTVSRGQHPENPQLISTETKKTAARPEKSHLAKKFSGPIPLRQDIPAEPDWPSPKFELPLSARHDLKRLEDLLPRPLKPLPETQNAGVVTGRVVDQSGATIPGAAVSLRHQSSGETQQVVTDENGRFRIPKVTPGELRLEVVLPGFKTLRILASLKGGESLDVNGVLEIGGLAETVTVTSGSPTIQTLAAMVKGLGFLGGRRAERQAEKRQPDHPGWWERSAKFLTETYDLIVDNPFIRVDREPLATFSIDVDTASYANVRRFLNQGRVPPKDSVRIEELVNYFRYHYAEPEGKDPVAIRIDSASAPWSPEHRLVRIAIKAKEVDLLRRPPSNLVFLIDVSGSMQPENKLPLVKSALRLLADKLNEKDRISIVVYAGASGLVLPPTSGSDRRAILAALNGLQAGGSTNGATGIQLAYQTAEANFVTGGINRVVLATDGDFNVGITSQGDLIRLIQEKAKSGVFLSILGFGMGNYKDSTLEKLADKGNGNYAYIDTLNEARKVLVEQMSGTLMTVAKDVKLQIEFNPAEVGAYRLIGYENRVLNHQDFNDDSKDAGDIGAGLAVTALFDVIPRGLPIPAGKVDSLKYQKPSRPNSSVGGELLTIKLRYKEPDGNQSRLLEVPFRDARKSFSETDQDFRFAAAVAAFGMILRDSPYKGISSIEDVLQIARTSLDGDEDEYKAEFIQLVEKARSLASPRKP